MESNQHQSTAAREQTSSQQSHFRSTNTLLWGFVVVALVLDIVLTYYGLSLGLQESNPVARAFFVTFGVIESMLLLKGIVIAVALIAYVSVPDKYRPVIPLGIALPWFVAGVINASLILQV